LRRNPSATDLELALELDVKPETVRRYRYRLRNLSQDWTKFCPECYSPDVWLDRERGEHVCRSCGFVVEEEAGMVHTLPFDETYALESNIAFGKSLGNTLNIQKTYRVLAKLRSRENDQGKIPIRQITTLTQTVDPPVVRNMLSYGSRMLKQLGLEKDTESCHLLADRLGRTLRKIGAFLHVSRMQVRPYMLARAAVYVVLSRRGMHDKAAEAQQNFPFKEKHVKLVEKLEDLNSLEKE